MIMREVIALLQSYISCE